jgi:hypothetical protein
MTIINLDDSNVWFQACEQWVALFQCVMTMAMETLAIAQHQNIVWCATIREGGY